MRSQHKMSAKRYYNDPDTRAFFEKLDSLTWYENLIGWVLFLCFVPVALVARLFGWRPK